MWLSRGRRKPLVDRQNPVDERRGRRQRRLRLVEMGRMAAIRKHQGFDRAIGGILGERDLVGSSVLVVGALHDQDRDPYVGNLGRRSASCGSRDRATRRSRPGTRYRHSGRDSASAARAARPGRTPAWRPRCSGSTGPRRRSAAPSAPARGCGNPGRRPHRSPQSTRRRCGRPGSPCGSRPGREPRAKSRRLPRPCSVARADAAPDRTSRSPAGSRPARRSRCVRRARGKIAPHGDTTEPLVQQHQRRRVLGRWAMPRRFDTQARDSQLHLPLRWHERARPHAEARSQSTMLSRHQKSHSSTHEARPSSRAANCGIRCRTVERLCM